MRKLFLGALLAATAAGLLTFLPGWPLGAEGIAQVFVTNLPNPQPIVGQVSVRGTVRHAVDRRITDLVVSPAQRWETNQLTDGGILETDGFTSLALSLHGETKGTPARAGDIGVLLVPEEEPIRRALLEDGEIHLALEATATAAPGQGAYFSAVQPHLPIAFGRYRILLYNATDKSAAVHVFFYLTY